MQHWSVLFTSLYLIMARLGAQLLFLILQSTALFAGQYSGMQEGFLMAFVESVNMDYIMIVRNSSGNISVHGGRGLA